MNIDGEIMRFNLLTYRKFLILVLLCGAFYVQTVSAQKIKVLSFENIMNALADTTSGMSSDELLNHISDRVKVWGVDFKWSEEKERELREAGAPPELIETIRRESLRETISQKDSSTANEYYNNGLKYLDALQYDYAIDNFEKAIEINPRLGLAYGGLGLAHYERENYELAIEYYSKAIAASPALAFYLNRGAAYDHIKSYDKAARDYSQVIKSQPNNKKAYFNRGAAYFSSNQFDKAITDFEKVLELDPNYPKAQKKLDLCRQLQARKESQ